MANTHSLVLELIMQGQTLIREITVGSTLSTTLETSSELAKTAGYKVLTQPTNSQVLVFIDL